MKIRQSEALVLRTYPYLESHKIVVFLTRKYGKVRGIAYGARKPKSKHGGSFELLTQVQLTFSRKENQDLATVRNCEILQTFFLKPVTWEVSLYLSYFAELLEAFSSENEESENLMRLALAVIEVISELSTELVVRYFELWLLKLEGVLPPLQTQLPQALATKTSAFLKKHPSQLEGVILTSGERERLESVCHELIEYHLEKDLKSQKILKKFIE